MQGKMLCATLKEPQNIQIEYVDIPVPGKGQVLLKIKRIGLCGSDSTIYYGLHPYVSYPLIMGHEFSAEIVRLGDGVEGLHEGQRVAVIPHLVCGECDACKNEIYNFCEELRCTGAEADGAHREYMVMPSEMVLPIPDTVSYDDAAMIEPACVAYHAAKRPAIKPDDKVLIIGAGPIGNFCMQSVKTLGAEKVYVADVDQSRLELALTLGAEGVINVSEQSLEDGIKQFEDSAKKISVYFDCVGSKGQVLNQILQLAARGSRVVMVGVLQNEYDIPNLPDFVQHELTLFGTTMYTPSDYKEMIDLMGSKKISTEGIITHWFDLKDIKEVFKDLVENKSEKYFKVIFKVDDQADDV